MGHIFYIMGKSSSGKDTVFKKLLQDPSLALETLVMYTTRPIRSNEKDGVEYHFVSAKEMEALEAEGRVIEKRTYATMHGDWNYFTVDDGAVDPAKHDYIMIGTLQSYVKIRDYYGKDRVLPMMIETDDGDRLQRALNRERRQQNPKYSEMCRRFLADEEDFSPDKKAAAGVDKEFRNDDLRNCLTEMKQFIKSIQTGDSQGR
ncbi:MAG: guanylate kinase [Lachnospiraceae bacterium]|nr:guanylate kinase [Lachnospiraceae bacterium]